MSPRFQSRRRRSPPQHSAPASSFVMLKDTIFTVLILLTLGVLYLSQVTKTSAYGYDVNKREDKLSSLIAEHQELANEDARLQALQRVTDSNVAAAMIDPEIEYARN